MNMEQQSQGVTYQPEFDFTTQAEWARPLGGGEGAIPTAAPTREQQVFTAWKEELNWDERLLETIADPGNLRRAYRKVPPTTRETLATTRRIARFPHPKQTPTWRVAAKKWGKPSIISSREYYRRPLEDTRTMLGRDKNN
jgi:hypothetical protein